MIYSNTDTIVWGALIFFTLLMQVLHWLKVNVFKVVILLGTFALALAFAGNDLVNFIGVPLAGYSSYMDLMAQGGTTTTDTFLMESLLEPAKTPWYFLVGSGLVMVIALATSKKAQAVIKTSVDWPGSRMEMKISEHRPLHVFWCVRATMPPIRY